MMANFLKNLKKFYNSPEYKDLSNRKGHEKFARLRCLLLFGLVAFFTSVLLGFFEIRSNLLDWVLVILAISGAWLIGLRSSKKTNNNGD